MPPLSIAIGELLFKSETIREGQRAIDVSDTQRGQH